MVAGEAIVLAAREVIVLIALVAFLAWAARKVVRESRRDAEPAPGPDEGAAGAKRSGGG